MPASNPESLIPPELLEDATNARVFQNCKTWLRICATAPPAVERPRGAGLLHWLWRTTANALFKPREPKAWDLPIAVMHATTPVAEVPYRPYQTTVDSPKRDEWLGVESCEFPRIVSIESEYRLGSVLREGRNSTIYEVEEPAEPERVVKRIPADNKIRERHAIAEYTIMKRCKHPNMVPALDSILDDNFIYIVMPRSRGPSLSVALRQGPFSEPQIACAMAQAVEGLVYLHALGIIHSDIKSSNMLVFGSNLAITDYGCGDFVTGAAMAPLIKDTRPDDHATRLDGDPESPPKRRQRICGSCYWVAPESLIAFEIDQRSDVYSLGCLCYELAMGHPPYYGHSPLVALFFRSVLGIPDHKRFGEGLRSFIASCTHPDPALRPTAEELRDHPFLQVACPADQFLGELEKRSTVSEMIAQL